MYTLDGKDLDDPRGRWVLESGTALPTWGEPRLTSVDVPGRFGVLAIPATVTNAQTVLLKFRVFSWSDGGVSRCKGTLTDLDANLRALMNRLRVLGRLPVLGFTPDGGTLRVAEVRLKGAVEPEFDPEALTVALAVTYEISDGMWHDPQPTVQQLTDTKRLDGGTAPIVDAALMLAPSANEMVIKDVTSGSTLTWKGSAVPAADDRIIVDVQNYSAYRQTSTDWPILNNAVDVSGQISMSAGGFRMVPNSDGQIRLTVTGGTGYVRARRAY
nr:MAG TPA: hypothetical protein [Caudoviricetes sp.]